MYLALFCNLKFARNEVNIILLLQTASTEMDVVTVATEAPQFPDTHVSRGMLNALINTKSMDRFTKQFMIVAIYVAIQEGSRWMGRGVSPQIRPYVGNTVMCLNVPNDVSRLTCEDYFSDWSESLECRIKGNQKAATEQCIFNSYSDIFLVRCTFPLGKGLSIQPKIPKLSKREQMVGKFPWKVSGKTENCWIWNSEMRTV